MFCPAGGTIVRTRLVLSSIAIVLMSVQPLAAGFGIGECTSSATSASGVLVACPAGDGDALGANGLTITVTCLDAVGYPIDGIPASDIWLIGCNAQLTPCGSHGIAASGPTDANGQTTITGTFAAGGCDVSGVRVVVQNFVIGAVCNDPCVPVGILSPDLNGDGMVTLTDVAMFSAGYPSPPKSFDPCLAFYPPHDGVSLSSLVVFAQHLGHHC